jgi:hypothetical protein
MNKMTARTMSHQEVTDQPVNERPAREVGRRSTPATVQAFSHVPIDGSGHFFRF